ncbi:unnamed protein product, partial [Scytosiphon promiscuus]
LLDWQQVPDFLSRTKADVLAVTVGNVHGRYARRDPRLDLTRLELVSAAAENTCHSPLSNAGEGTLLAIHGASGLPGSQVQASISLGVSKFNVNTEVRRAAVDLLLETARNAAGSNGVKAELLAILDGSVERMGGVIEQKMLEFDPR